MDIGILYVVFNRAFRDPDTNELFYKIGITKNTVDVRYHDSNLKMPGKFETLFAYRLENYSKAEQTIHNILSKYREKGEWFKISQNELDHIQKTCEIMGGVLVKEEAESEAKIKAELNIETKIHQPVQNIIIHSDNPINPNYSCKVFLFPIQNNVAKGISIYESTRRIWKVIEIYRNVSQYEFAVGLQNGLSLGSYRIKNWNYLSEYKKCEFIGEEISDFKGFTWNAQINIAKGYWQRGNHFVVEFDGNGKFRLERPNTNNQWFNCL